MPQVVTEIEQAKAAIKAVIDQRNEKQLDEANRCLIQAFDLLCAAAVVLRHERQRWMGREVAP